MRISKYFDFDGSLRIFIENDSAKHVVRIKKNWLLEIVFDTEMRRFLPTGYVLSRDYLEAHEKAKCDFGKQLKQPSSRAYLLRSAYELIDIVDVINGDKTIKSELQNVIERHKSKF